MFFIKFLRYFIGFVRFRIYSEFPERMINQLGKNEIAVWNIVKKENYIEADMFKKDYLNIRSYKMKNRAKTKVITRHGLPFILKKYKARAGLLVGFLIFIFCILMFRNYIWNITVSGNEKIDSNSIVKALNDLGLKEGVQIKSVDTRKLPSQLKLKLDGIAWATINIEGTVANVEITESVKAEIEGKEPSNLIASQDGTVTMLLITGGTKKVKVNQTVRKGDLLVSGIVEYKNGSSHFVRSTGQILARTNEKIIIEVPFEEEYIMRTGKVVTKSVLKTPFFNLPLFLGDVNFQYEKVLKEEKISNGNYYLPFVKISADCYEIIKNTIILSQEQAEERGNAKLEYQESELLKDAKILAKTVNTELKDDRLIVIGEYICEKNIAVEEKILFGTVN